MMLTYPNLPPARSAFKVVPNTQALFSPYNQVEEIWEEPGDKWHVSIQYNLLLTQTEGRDLRAFLHKLRGQSGRFYLHDYSHQNRGNLTGAVVDGANQYGLALDVRNLPVNTRVAFVGDRFQLGRRLHELVDDATTDAQGKTRLVFVPEILDVPADGTALVTDKPAACLMLKDAKQIPDFSGAPRVMKNIKLQFIEALR